MRAPLWVLLTLILALGAQGGRQVRLEGAGRVLLQDAQAAVQHQQAEAQQVGTAVGKVTAQAAGQEAAATQAGGQARAVVEPGTTAGKAAAASQTAATSATADKRGQATAASQPAPKQATQKPVANTQQGQAAASTHATNKQSQLGVAQTAQQAQGQQTATNVEGEQQAQARRQQQQQQAVQAQQQEQAAIAAQQQAQQAAIMQQVGVASQAAVQAAQQLPAAAVQAVEQHAVLAQELQAAAAAKATIPEAVASLQAQAAVAASAEQQAAMAAQQAQAGQAGQQEGLFPLQLLAERLAEQQRQAGLGVPQEAAIKAAAEAASAAVGAAQQVQFNPGVPENVPTLLHQAEPERPRPRDPNGLWTFENDPVPAQVPISEWQHTDVPEEVSSSSFLTENATRPDYVAMCLVIRDQQEDIVEWVQHHLRLGVSKIYVFDNGSDPPLWRLLQKYMLQGVVVYEHFTTFKHYTDRPQLYAYDRCLHDYGHKHTWMVFTDVDEFLIFKEGPPVQSLPDYLVQFEKYSGLGVHWILFGSSGHVTRPSRGVLRSYYKCLPLMHTQHQLIKTIANTRCTTGAWGPHAFHHNCSLPVVRPNHEAIYGPRAERPQYGRLALHHYATKSLEEFKMKMKRGSGMRRQRGMEYFWFVDAWSVDYNFDGLRVWDDITSYQNYPSVQQLQGRYDSLPVHAWNAKRKE